MTPLHSDASRLLTRWQPPNVEQQALRAEFVALLDDRPDAMRRDCVPSHVTASTLVLDASGEHVLLVLHRKVRLWMQPGGHCEDADATLASAALREAQEETGIANLRLRDVPIDLDKHAAPCAPGVARWHFDVRFVAVADRAGLPVTSDESLDVRWFAADALPGDCVPDLARFVAVARGIVAAAGTPDRAPGLHSAR